MEKEKILNKKIEELNLSIRSYNALKRRGVKTISDIVSLGKDELYKVRNLGKFSVKEIVLAVANFGVTIPERGMTEKEELYEKLLRNGWEALDNLPDKAFEKGTPIMDDINAAVMHYLSHLAKVEAEDCTIDCEFAQAEEKLDKLQQDYKIYVDKRRRNLEGVQAKKEDFVAGMKTKIGEIRHYHHKDDLKTEKRSHSRNPFFEKDREI